MSDDEDLVFLSTQMQYKYEASKQQENSETISKHRSDFLKRFKNPNSEPSTGEIKKRSAKAKSRKSTNSTKRIRSMTSHVEQLFGASDGQKSDSQQSILSYFSGKKHKISEILSRLDQQRAEASPTPSLRDSRHPIPYSREEWAEITLAIKENLPHLLDATKKTLASLTHKIEQQALFDTTQTSESNLWHKSSKLPSITMTPDELKNLYDLNSDQMVPIASESSENTRIPEEICDINEDDEVPDSCSEPEILGEIRHNEEGSVEELVPLNRLNGTIDVLDSITGRDSIKGIDFGEPQAIDSDTLSDEHEIIVSSSMETPSVVNSPKKLRLVASTPTKKLNSRLNISPLKLTPPEFPDTFESDSVYATAVSQLPELKYRKRFIEVDGDVSIQEIDNDRVKIRKLESEEKLQEDEIQDSDLENNHISIIELSTLIEESEEELDTEELIQTTKSVVQVPSSPTVDQPLDFQGSVIASDCESEMSQSLVPIDREFSQMTHTQLKTVFKDLGLKPVQGKAKMVEILQNTSQIIQTQDPTQLTQQEFNQQLYDSLTKVIQNDSKWLEKINSYEPISIHQLKSWLETQNVVCEIDVLEAFCDQKGICCTNQEQKL